MKVGRYGTMDTFLLILCMLWLNIHVLICQWSGNDQKFKKKVTLIGINENLAEKDLKWNWKKNNM